MQNIKTHIPIKTKTKLRNEWGVLSDTAKEMSKYVLRQKEEYEKSAIRESICSDSDFKAKLKEKLYNAKKQSLKRAEKDDEYGKSQALDELLEKI
jgi:hypothetical protein